MAEWNRIFQNRRLCIAILVILLLNGFLFIREQKIQNYGMDCAIPTPTISFQVDGGGYEIAQETVDSRAAYERYLQWLENYTKLPLEQAISALQTEKDRLTAVLENYGEEENVEKPTEVYLDYVAVNHLLKQAAYLHGYKDYLNMIQANKDALLSFSIFNDPNEFSGRNILKTANEFEALQDISLRLGIDGAIHAFMGFSITDYLLLAVLVLVCVAFLDERKKGLWNIVYALYGGRLRLAIQRVSILLCVSVIGVTLLYGTNLLVGFFIYGGIRDLGRAAQSVELLGNMPIRCTVGEFLLQYLLFKIGAAFLVALLLWLIFSAIRNVKYTIIAASGMLAAEYSFYTFLPVQSGWNMFKYFNIFTYITSADLYTNYLNIDLFGYPVGIRAVSQNACLPIILLLVGVCITIHCHKRPASGRILLGHFAYGINRITDGFLRRFHLLGMELYKTLFIQKGILLIILFFYCVPGLIFTVNIPVGGSKEAAARAYTAQLSGPITADTMQQIRDISSELDTIIAAHASAKVQYENGTMEYPQYDVFVRAAQAAETNKNGLSIVRERVEELCSLGKGQDFTPWLIEDSPYEGTYGTPAKPNQSRVALVAMLTITLLLTGSMAYETQTGMNELLASTQNGRKRLFFIKISTAAILTTLVWAVTYGLEFYTFLGVGDIGTFPASVQNLSMLENFPVKCSIGTFLIGIYLYRWFALFVCAVLTMLVSSCVKRLETACIAACSVILLPSVLYLFIGLEPLKFLSLALAIACTPIIPANGSMVIVLVIGTLPVSTISIAIYAMRKRIRL